MLAGLSGSDWLASVDCFGRARLQQLPGSCSEGDPPGSASPALLLDPPSSVASAEAGWVGIALAPCRGSSSEAAGTSGSGAVATALRFGKAAAVYDVGSGALTRTFRCLGYPTAVSWAAGLSGAPDGLLSVAEESRISLWDVRQVGDLHSRILMRSR